MNPAGQETAVACPICGSWEVFEPSPTGRTRRCPRCSVPVDGHACDTRVAGPGSTTPAPAVDAPMLHARFGKYDIVREAARGAMGVVYQAWEPGLQRAVALKVLRSERPVAAPGQVAASADEELQRFLREARTTAALQHPGIVQVHEVGEIDGHPFIAMEWVEGGSLRDYMDGRRLVTDPRVLLRWLAAIARAVHFAHQHGVIHRDLKPENILLKPDPDAVGAFQPKVVDFGLAREVDAQTRITRTGQVMGTPAYMSPEQSDGGMTVDARSDVFSLGCVLYEVLCGRRAFDGPSPLAILYAVLHQDPVPARRIRPDIGADFETVVQRAMEKSPSRRYAGAGELADDLERALRGEPVQARPVSTMTRLARQAVRHRAMVGVVLMSLSLTGALTAYLHRERAERARAEEERAAMQRRAELEKRRSDLSQRVLDKAGLVQDVLARWVAIAEPIRELVRNSHVSHWSSTQVREAAEKPWRAVAQFVERTPDDATSRATSLALAGWARWHAGYAEEGLRWMRDARALDPDLPYGALMESFCWLWDYLLLQPMAAFSSGNRDGLVFWQMPDETEEMKQIRLRIEALVEDAGRAQVWGEKLARDFRGSMAAMQALQSGRYEEAEQALTAAVGSSALVTAQTELLYARAKVRCLLGTYDEGLRDLDEVLAVWPDEVTVRFYSGLQAYALAERAVRSGADPSGHFDRALREFAGVLERVPEHGDAAATRGSARMARAGWVQRQGGDPLPDLDRAVSDYARAMTGPVDRNDARYNHATALHSRWQLRWERGDRECGDLVRAIEEMDRVIVLAPEYPSHWDARGRMWYSLARAVASLGDDPGSQLEAALADATHAAAGTDANASSGWYEFRGRVGLAVAAYRASQGDVRTQPEIQASLLALEEAIRRDPDVRAYRTTCDEAQRMLDAATSERTRQLWHAERMVELGAYSAAGVLFRGAFATAPGPGAAPADRLMATSAYNLACVESLASVGRRGPLAVPTAVPAPIAAEHRAAAFRAIETAVQAGYADALHLGQDPDLEPLHADPRWAAVLERVGAGKH